MPNYLFLTVAVGALALAGVSQAADAPTVVDDLIVTATRTPEPPERVGQQVSVIDAARIRALQTPVLADVLATVPGVTFSRNGPVGSATQVYLRGAQPGQTLVLIDGVKLNNPAATDSAYNFGNLLVGDIDRIEVLRGPQSTLWGSQAMGGVVNLITAEPTRPFEADVTAEGGSHDWAMGRAAVGGKTDRVSWRASAAYLTTSGVSAYDQGREPDGFHNVGASARAEVRLTDEVSLDLRGVLSRGRVDFDGFPPPTFSFADTDEYAVMRDELGYVGLNAAAFDGRLKNRLGFAYTRTSLNDYDPSLAPDDVTFASVGQNQRFEYQGTWTISQAWRGVFGAETERSSIRSGPATTFSSELRRTATLDGLYAELQGDILSNLTIQAGVRHDHHSDFGDHTVGQASLAWRPTDTTIVRASWGQGFKAPSLYQLGSEYGNLELRPETSNGWDAGVEQRLLDGRMRLQAAYFERRNKSEIDFFTCLTGTSDPLCVGANGFARFGYYANLDATRSRGIELSAEAQLTEALSLQANYTWLDARNRTPGFDFDKRMARRPQDDGRVDLAYRWPNDLTTALAVRAVGSRFDDAGDLVRLKGYVLWDVRAAYPITPAVEVYGRIENMFDKRYETIAGYGELGRAAYAGLRVRF